MTLQGKRVSLRPLTRQDLDEVESWTPFTHPLDLAWNRYPWHRLGKDLWYEIQSIDPATERYAVLDGQGRVIGVIGLVLTDDSLTPTLSIFLGADYVGQGLGPDALRTLLRHVFLTRRLRAVRLDVAATNARARRAYEKCGFHVTRQHYRPVEEWESLAFLDEPRYQHLRSFYRQEDGRTYTLFHRMEVTAEDWVRRERNLPSESA